MLFEPIQVKSYTLKNKIIMAPMCMYQSDNSGEVKDFHRTHYMFHAMGGVSLVMVEATAVMKNGRISKQDLGIWSDEHIKGLKTVTKHIHQGGALASIQINHAGRKTRDDDPIAPSALRYDEKDVLPKAMTLEDIKEVIQAFQDAAKRALEAGFDGLEIHAAHGYLLSQFMSPLSNQRNDKYGQPHVMIQEVLEVVKDVWPKDRILTIRVSGTEYHPDGFDIDDVIDIFKKINLDDVDFVHVSSGGNIRPQTIELKPGYQLSLAQKIKTSLGIKTIGGGLINDVKFAEKALTDGDCDMVFFGRLLLRDPMYFLRHSEHIEWPKAYIRGK